MKNEELPVQEKFTVKFLDTEEKSPKERETELFEEQQEEPPAPPEPIEGLAELKDEDVLGFLGKRFNKTYASLDEVVAEKVVEKEVELPEDVNAFFKYKKETGRGMEDFMKLNKDFDSMEEDDLLAEYYRSSSEGLDDEDIETMVSEFHYDEDFDEEGVIKKKKLSKKKALNEAKKFFASQKDKYKVPLESSMASLSDEEKNEFDEYRKYKEVAANDNDLALQKGKVFEQKTNELFTPDFKGFDFKIDDKTITFNPADALEIKNSNSNPMNLIGKFLDKDGFIADPVGYHRALTVATFADRFAKHFYDQGKADATSEVLKDIKNTDTGERKTPQGVGKEGLQVKFLNEDSKFGVGARKQ